MKAVIRKDAGGPGRLLGWPGLVVTAVCRHLTPGLLSRAGQGWPRTLASDWAGDLGPAPDSPGRQARHSPGTRQWRSRAPMTVTGL